MRGRSWNEIRSADEEQCRDLDGNDFRPEGRDCKIECSAAVVVALEAEIAQILFVSFHLNVSTSVQKKEHPGGAA